MKRVVQDRKSTRGSNGQRFFIFCRTKNRRTLTDGPLVRNSATFCCRCLSSCEASLELLVTASYNAANVTTGRLDMPGTSSQARQGKVVASMDFLCRLFFPLSMMTNDLDFLFPFVLSTESPVKKRKSLVKPVRSNERL